MAWKPTMGFIMMPFSQITEKNLVNNTCFDELNEFQAELIKCLPPNTNEKKIQLSSFKQQLLDYNKEVKNCRKLKNISKLDKFHELNEKINEIRAMFQVGLLKHNLKNFL